MSVFKQNPSRATSHRRSGRPNTQTRATNPSPTATSNTPFPSYSEYPTPTGASSGSIPSGHTISFPWNSQSGPLQPSGPSTSGIAGGELYSGISYAPASSYNAQFPAQASFPDVSSSVYPSDPYDNTSEAPVALSITTGQSFVILKKFGTGLMKKTPLHCVDYDLPSFHCACGAKVRILNTQNYGIPVTGLLWNFKLDSTNHWIESPMGSPESQGLECPVCQGRRDPTFITLCHA